MRVVLPSFRARIDDYDEAFEALFEIVATAVRILCRDVAEAIPFRRCIFLRAETMIILIVVGKERYQERKYEAYLF